MLHMGSEGESMKLTSSIPNCVSHMILWEAAIDGLVTTAPNSGSLPIKDVSIYYELLDPLHIPIDCEGCSGEVISGEGGEFKIHIKSAHPRFVDSEDTQFPIRLKYSKTIETTNTSATSRKLIQPLLQRP